MPVNFYDTSALIKYYHSESGSGSVKSLADDADSEHVISRLAMVELQSAIAKKVRMDQLSLDESQEIQKQFARDVKVKRWKVLKLLMEDYHYAEGLIHSIGHIQNLRTLDALQLSLALRLKEQDPLFRFICSDVTLSKMADEARLYAVTPS